MDNEKKIVLFGAGIIGKRALQYFGQNRVHCFVDNNEKMIGEKIQNIPVISFHQLREVHEDYQIVISADLEHALAIAEQLEDAGIQQYEIFLKILREDSKGQTAEITVQNQHALNSEEKNRVLMVAYYFPPLSISGSFRSIKFAKYLPQFGWHPTVIATDNTRPNWNYKNENSLKEIPIDVPVIRIPDTISTFQESFTPEIRKQLLDFLENIVQESKEAYDLYTSLLKNKTDIAKLLIFPCTALLWAYRTVQYIETNMNIRDFCVIYTTSVPYSSHLIGFYFKQKYGIPWVADYRDQWTENPLLAQPFDPSKPYDQLLFHLESILLRNASCNITVGLSETIEYYVSRFQIPEKKIVSITNGYDEEDFVSFRTKVDQTDKFIINYSGLLYGNRNIDTILISLQELIAEGQVDLANVQFRIVGDATNYDPKKLAQKYNLESIVVQTGYVSHGEAIRSNLEANLLLYLLGDEERFRHVFLGKIFDYLRSGRPVLAIAPPGGVIDQILRETGHGHAFISTQISEIKAMILQEYKKWEKGEHCDFLCSPLIKQFERKHLTKKLVQIFENIQQDRDDGEQK